MARPRGRLGIPASAQVVVLGYPGESSGFFVKSGFGVARAIVEDEVVRFQTDAYAGQLGLGWDFGIGRGVSVTAYANYVWTVAPATWVNGISVEQTVSPNVVQAGLALTVH